MAPTRSGGYPATQSRTASQPTVRHVDVGGAGHRGLPGVNHDHLGATVSGPPEVLGGHRETLTQVGPGHHDDLAVQHVGPRVGGPVDTERPFVGGRGRDHAQPAVVVDVAGPQPDPGELAHQIRLLGGDAGP